MPLRMAAIVLIALFGLTILAILWRWVVGLRRPKGLRRKPQAASAPDRSHRPARSSEATGTPPVTATRDRTAGGLRLRFNLRPKSPPAPDARTGPAGSAGSAPAPAGTTPAAGSRPLAVARSGIMAPPINAAPQWVGATESITVGDFAITGPMTWFVRSRKVKAADPAEPSAVLLGLDVEPAPVHGPWPEAPVYADLDPGRRYRYLAWLASGRRQAPGDPAMLVLFLMGLERRVLADRRDETWVFAELLRLRRLATVVPAVSTGASAPRSQDATRARVLRIASHLLWHLTGTRPDRLGLEQVHELVRTTITWSDESLSTALGWFAFHQAPLPPWMAFVAAGETKHAQRSVVVSEHRDTLRDLFAERYRERWPEGFRPEPAKRPFVSAYQPLNPTLRPERQEIPNPLGRASQFKPLADLWNGCIEDLRPYRRAVQRQSGAGGGMVGADPIVLAAADGVPASEGSLSVEAWNALPLELRRRTEHPLTEPLGQLMAAQETGPTDAAEGAQEEGATADTVAAPSGQSSGAVAIVAIGDIASLLDYDPRPRLTRRQGEALAEAAEHAGYAIEPDPRLTGQPPAWDDLVALFFRVSETPARPEHYLAAACLMRMGYAVAASDGRADDAELSLVAQHLDEAFELNAHEARRIDALRWLLHRDPSGADVTRIGRQLQRAVADAGARVRIGRLLVSVAAADAVITNEEIATLRQAFRALGLDHARLDEILAEARQADLPAEDQGASAAAVDAGAAERGQGNAEPAGIATAAGAGDVATTSEVGRAPGSPATGGLVLDRALMASIMLETRQVAALLAEAMRVHDPDARDDADDDDEVASADLRVVRRAATPDPKALRTPNGSSRSMSTRGTAGIAALPAASSRGPEDAAGPPRPIPAPAAPVAAESSDSASPPAAAGAAPADPGDGAETTPSDAFPSSEGPRPGGRYDAFYLALLGRDAWAADEAQALARTHGHMLAGAVEAINDWAFETLGDALVVDEGERIVIEHDLLRG